VKVLENKEKPTQKVGFIMFRSALCACAAFVTHRDFVALLLIVAAPD
jgi:hypothetical protein